jgi:hypothetical protein
MADVPIKLRRAKESVEREFLDREGVLGVDIGLKEVKGEPTDTLSIRVLVANKRDVPKDQQIPSQVRGQPTDVIQRRLRPFVMAVAAEELESQPDTDAYDPLRGGISIGPCRLVRGNAFTGTLGAIVDDQKTGRPMLLSNFHVLAIDNTWSVGDLIAQPSRPDSGVCPRSVAGELERAVLGDEVDCAVAWATREAQYATVDIGDLKGTGSAAPGGSVRKRGRTTGLTYGIVDTIDLTLQIDYGGDVGVRVFTNQIGVKPHLERSTKFAGIGDSGAILIDTESNVVGLCFGGDEETGYGIANPIHPVLDALKVSISTSTNKPHGSTYSSSYCPPYLGYGGAWPVQYMPVPCMPPPLPIPPVLPLLPYLGALPVLPPLLLCPLR